MPSEVNVTDTDFGKDSGEDESEEQSVTLLTVSTTSQESPATVKCIETSTIRNNSKILTCNDENNFIERSDNASLPLETDCIPTENGLQQLATASCQMGLNDNAGITKALHSLEEQNECSELKCNKENASSRTVAGTASASFNEAQDNTGDSNKLSNEIAQDSSQKLTSSHKLLTRKKCFVAGIENSRDKIVGNLEQLPLSSRNMIRKKQFFSRDLQSSSTESQYEQNTRDQRNNNDDNIFSDNTEDSCMKGCNLPLEDLASCSNIDQSQFQSTSLNEAHRNDVINAHKVISLIENNNKNASENLSKLNEPGSSHSHVPKNVPKSQNTLADLVHCNDVIRKPFKLPILENLHETASIQQNELEENAVALLEPSSAKQDRLDEAQGIDMEPPHSSNSSDASNSDTESQQAVLGHSGTKKVEFIGFS